MKVVSLFSGSKGNSTLVQIQNTNLLIDCGKNYKQINLSLEQLDLSIDDIKYILITHRHTDHISALKTIYSKNSDIKFITTLNIYNDIKESLQYDLDSKRFMFIDRMKLKNIKYFPLNHDVNCVGYLLYENSGESLCFISDNGGFLSNDIKPLLSNHTYYCIESNYDRTMEILNDKRHEGLKRRCLGWYGHTDNVDAIKNAIDIVGDKTKHIMFTHLSSHCNSVELAYNTHINYIGIWGEKTKFKDIKIHYAVQDEIVILE